MTTPDADILVVGSGPAGVSVALPLVEAGLRVLMVDGGREPSAPPVTQPFLTARASDRAQWTWMIGRDFYTLRRVDALSPKLRVPAHAATFADFNAVNRIHTAGDFAAIGSLARGGLSNAWGCGVARLTADELRVFPVDIDDMEQSYARVARRIGISGAGDDDLADYFGLDAWADPPIDADVIQAGLLDRYRGLDSESRNRVRLGRSRVAALSRPHAERAACNLSGNCLWGCPQGSLYSAEHDLKMLLRHPRFAYRPGFVVEQVGETDGLRFVHGNCNGDLQRLTAYKVALAAGTLATTRLALQADHIQTPVPLRSCPVSAFMLWIPRSLGARRMPGFGLGQLSYVLECEPGVRAFGSLFSTTGIPVSEFARFTPLPLPCGIDVLRALLSSCVAGNLALPGHLTNATATLEADGALRVRGQYDECVPELIQNASQQLRAVFRRLGAWVMPGSFKPGIPGADIHYAGTLPMSRVPDIGQTDALGELQRQRNLHIVDGACLPVLTEKSHTLTIMANADRIGRALASQLSAR